MEHSLLPDFEVTPMKKQSICRVALACIQCRSRKVRCDATQPGCNRCLSDGKQCKYQKSRRGGRPRRPLPVSQPTGDGAPSASEQQVLPLLDELFGSTTDSDTFGIGSAGSSLHWQSDTSEDILNLETTVLGGMHLPDTLTQQLLSQYYVYFHVAHPCVLPKWSLQQRLASDTITYEALLAVILYIGSIFTHSVDSEPLKNAAAQAITAARTRSGASSPYYIQALLLYAIVVYWCDEPERGQELLDEVIREARNLGMHRAEFASQHGQGDPVLEESWRRTWWQIYITDAHISGSTHSYPTQTGALEITTDLPCEEQQYESGNIPRPATIRSYDMREFSDAMFSSFAQLVGFTLGINRALATRRINDIENARIIAEKADIAIAAWYSLLPPSQKRSLRDDGSVDELLFKAHILMHTYIVDIHRQLSTLKYFPIESVSKCIPPPPPESIDTIKDEAHIHTAKVFMSIEKLNGLLTLPTRLDEHTPFTICMIALMTIAHLSACCYIFKEPRLTLEREKIRLNMGALKMLGDVWPAGRREYHCMAIIAREILRLEDEDVRPLTTTGVMPLNVADSNFDFDVNCVGGTWGTVDAFSFTDTRVPI